MTVPAVGHEDKHWWERRAHEHELAGAQAAALLNQIASHLSLLRTEMLAPPVDDVMYNGVAKIGADGTFRLTCSGTMASVRVTNYSADQVTATEGDANGAAPTEGRGVVRIPSGYARTFPMRGTSLVVWGTATTKVDLEVYLRPRDPAIAACGTAT